MSSVRWLLPLSAVLFALWGCDEGGVGNVQAGFRVEQSRLDFGKALVGENVTRELELLATGRGTLTISLATSAPFEAPASIELPGGGAVRVPISWRASPGNVERTLTLSARDESFEVILVGRGVEPQQCRPTAGCREAHFDLQTERCVETVSEDGTGCTPAGLCLENGVCRGGECKGTPRSCDDGNVCTSDACSPEVGCVNTDISSQCPRPANPCETATCHPTNGCGTREVDEGTICGAVDCVTANFCVSGACVELPTPEGFLCAPATPCQDEGRCQNKTCRRPDAGSLQPEWSVPFAPDPPLDGGVVRLGSEGIYVYFTGCGFDSLDGGCGVTSYTPNGFMRFESLLPSPGTIAGVSGGTLAVSHPDALSAFTAATGAPLWSVPLEVLPLVGPDGGSPSLSASAVSVDVDGGVHAALAWSASDGDGGVEPLPFASVVQLDPDGGVIAADTFGDAGTPLLTALSSGGTLYLYDPEGPLACVDLADGGAGYVPLGDFAGAPTLAVAEGHLFPGGAAIVASDGGVRRLLADASTGAPELPASPGVLVAGSRGVVFFRTCLAPLPSDCAPEEQTLLVRSFDVATGVAGSSSVVLPAFAPGEVVGATLLGAPARGGVMTLTEATIDGGVRADLQAFFAGSRLLSCPVDGVLQVGGATFAHGRLYALVERPNGWRLEAYDLSSVPMESQGWSQPDGAQSARRER